VLGIAFADDAKNPAPLDDLAMLADWLDARTNLQRVVSWQKFDPSLE